MKILVLTQHYVPERCAPAARMSQLAAVWSQQGHAVHVVCAVPNHPTGVVAPFYRDRLYVHEVHEHGVHVHRAPLIAAPNVGVLARALSQGSFPMSALVVAALAVGRPDVIVTTSPPLLSATAAAALSRRWQVPLVFDVRDLWPGVFRAMGVLRNEWVLRGLERLERGLYRAARRIVVVSPAFVEPIMARGGVARSVLEVVPNGADLGQWSPAAAQPAVRERLGAGAPGTVLALYAGNHGQAQGLDVVLEATRRLPAHVRVAFVGQGSERERLMAAARDAGLDARVRFLAPVGPGELLEMYRAADLCVVPLRAVPELARCIPSKLFEIMACARPVAAALAGAGAHIVETSAAGLVVAPGDAAALAGAIERLADDAALRERLGQAGRRHVEAHYDRRALALRYLELLEAVAAG